MESRCLQGPDESISIPDLGTASPYATTQCGRSPAAMAFRNCLFGPEMLNCSGGVNQFLAVEWSSSIQCLFEIYT